MLTQDVELENIINDSREYKHPKDEEFPELKKDSLICPSTHLQLRKQNSDVYDFSHHNIKQKISEVDRKHDNADDDYYNSFAEPICSLKNKRQKKKFISKELIIEQA